MFRPLLRTSRPLLRAIQVHTTPPADPGIEKLSSLADILARSLDKAKEMPPTALYRNNVELTTQFRLDCVRKGVEEGGVPYVEETINCGSIDDLLHQALDESRLMDHMIATKPWE